MAITVSNTGYIKRTAITNYRNQRRGGKGRIGMRTREEDFVSHLFVASTHAYIMIFSDRGRAYWLKVHEIPDVGPDGRGKAIANLVSMEDGERIAALLTVKEFEADKFIVMGTHARRGQEDRAERLQQPARRRHHRHGRRGGRRRHRRAASPTATARSSSARATAWRSASRRATSASMGRTAYGVRGISLREDDEVVAMEVLAPGGTILSVTEQGYGKRTELDEYRVQSRGGIGIINIQTSDRNGKVVGIAQVSDDDELMLITQQGKILRMASRDIRTIGRATQGVRLIDIEGDDRAVSIARLAEKDEEDDERRRRSRGRRRVPTSGADASRRLRGCGVPVARGAGPARFFDAARLTTAARCREGGGSRRLQPAARTVSSGLAVSASRPSASRRASRR